MINKNLKSIRQKQGLSQKQVADFLNISPQSVSKWEKGEALPSIEFLPKLSELLNCEINDFFAVNSQKEYDIEAIKSFIDFYQEYALTLNENRMEIIPLFDKHPNLIEEVTKLFEDFSQYKTVNQNVIQGILGCSKKDVASFLDFFLEHELLVKSEIKDSYIVMNDNFIGFKVILVCLESIHELLVKEK